jgi:hypothetical protein
MLYNKILIAKYSPKNKCYAPDNDWLIIAQEGHKMKGSLPEDHHFFIGIKSRQPSRYGWISTIHKYISSEELAEQYDPNPTQELINSCEVLLNAINKQPNGTSMACTFSVVGVLLKERILRVHRVFFYKA